LEGGSNCDPTINGKNEKEADRISIAELVLRL
jgi:hypothetical protein